MLKKITVIFSLFLLSTGFIVFMLTGSYLAVGLLVGGEIVVLATLSSVFFIVNKYCKQTNYYNNRHLPLRTFKRIPRNLEIVNLGSSQPFYAFDYSQIRKNGMNWAVAPQAFEYDYKILKYYHSYLGENAFVLIPICPFKFFLDRYPQLEAYDKYYGVLDQTLIHNFSKKGWLKLHYPALFPGQLIRLIRDSREIGIDEYSIPKQEAELEADAKSRIASWKRQFVIEDFDNINLSDKNQDAIEWNIELVKNILRFCIKRNYRPVFVVLPVSRPLSRYLPDEFVRKYIFENIDRANTEYNVPVLNIFGDDHFSNSEYFADSFFFNTKGRRAITLHLMNILDKSGELC